ncbi:L,D-transpeptidase [Massilia sp. Dwa41.01b]|uniref:L,D-transpeptidase n=1 Tax=unclassified Massilia TaxID=2609279 RepID=UPI0016008B49|nr:MULTISPECIES: L,D-transpeptidase [unclassified Massilia]QNA87662.1 L,D-transpeptidase [Massilia sp. Dwa41.01b]QNA98563.1 L,D-transpeptidase [Massilia sp. Se16.2.3]
MRATGSSPMPGAPKSRKLIKVDLRAQLVDAYDGSERVHRFACVSGDKDHATDRGKFKVQRKHPIYRSRAYNVQMNYAMFFTADGKALHQYHGAVPLSVVRTFRSKVSEWFGSHGCVRLSETDARILFEWTPLGTTVEVF